MRDFARNALAAMVGIVLVLTLLIIMGALTGDVGHEELDVRLEIIEQEARFQSCLLQFIPEERIERVIAECAVNPSD